MTKGPEALADRDTAPLDRARQLATALADASGGSAKAILLYGSHLLGARPDRNSALDFMVVVSDYRTFYRALHQEGEMHRPVWLFTALARILPPNVIAFTPGEGAAGIAKCLVVTWGHLEAALGDRPKDHFVLGRLVQKVAVIWSAGEAEAERLDKLIEGAHRRVLEWVGPYLDEPFDAEAVGRRLLEVCYRGEFRPEARDRSAVVFEAQRDHFKERLAPLLRRAAADGALAPAPDGYRFVNPPSRASRRRWDRHFTRSKVRVTLRWLKHVLTFDNWLPYVHRKAERRLGTTIELTRLERRWPLIFLWPRVVRVLLARPDREGPP
ncbi:MAG: hypothetical protein Q8N53_05895 [Longimicrobiales bacterium]|nr:hypothetical protein [Longimicrobiales bacterium]